MQYPDILQKAFDRYPVEVIKRYLSRIHFAMEIHEAGFEFGGSYDPFRRIIYLLAFNHTIYEQNKKGGLMAEKYVGKNALNGRVERFFISFIAPTYVVTVSANTPCGHMLLNSA